MSFVTLTRPDKTPVAINVAEVLSMAPVPPKSSPLAGPLDTGTRIAFKGGVLHQDVMELLDEVTGKMNA